MPQTFSVHLLPSLVPADELANGTVVVIDVLRASTTICYALAAGATHVIPCLEVGDALKQGESLPHAILGGEREGVLIDGFHLSNTPSEYTPEAVGDRPILFTTTNGTRAMQHARQAKEILIGAFVNLYALCERLQDVESIHLLCAGTCGEVSWEDTLLAGALAAEFARTDRIYNDEAKIALTTWIQTENESPDDPLAEALELGQGGENVVRIGRKADIKVAAQIGRFDFVPSLDVEKWRICRDR